MSDFNIKKIAALANLDIDETEITKLESQFKDIIQMVDQLSEVEFAGETLPFEIDSALSRKTLREDKLEKNFGPKLVQKNAPATEGDFLSVPQIIEKEIS